MKKVTFCKLKTSLSRNFIYNLQTFRGLCQVHFTILLQILHENNLGQAAPHWTAHTIACENNRHWHNKTNNAPIPETKGNIT